MLGELIDKLTIVNLKIWHLEDIKRDSDDDSKVANACRKTNVLNTQRNLLMEEIDNLMVRYHNGEKPKASHHGSTKIYGKQ
jgi:hypothetical protein